MAIVLALNTSSQTCRASMLWSLNHGIIFWVTDRGQGSGGCILRLSALFDKSLAESWIVCVQGDNTVLPKVHYLSIPAPLGIVVNIYSVESGLWNLLRECWSQQTLSLRFWACNGTHIQRFGDFEFGLWMGHSCGFRLLSDIAVAILNALWDISVLSEYHLFKSCADNRATTSGISAGGFYCWSSYFCWTFFCLLSLGRYLFVSRFMHRTGQLRYFCPAHIPSWDLWC